MIGQLRVKVKGATKVMKVRARLRLWFGDRCHACGKLMQFPDTWPGVVDETERVTIEHSRGVLKNDRDNVMYMRLVHRRCNV